jgi:3-oxoacyl-[acyl-carrier protein] reductase
MSLSQSRVALVTGTSRKAGIGAAIARELARDGADIFITYYRPYDREMGLASDPDEPQSLLAELRDMGRRADGLELDLFSPQAPKHLFDQVEANVGCVTILVNNATHSARDGIENLNADQLDKHYAINVRAMALLCAEFVRRYKQNLSPGLHGRIINLSSGQGLNPMSGELAYAATKGAVEAFSRSLSAEVGRFGITVNAVDPGATDTGWISSELREKWEAESPMGRIGVPEDAARMIRFLASAEAEWITGQIIHSRGGL